MADGSRRVWASSAERKRGVSRNLIAHLLKVRRPPFIDGVKHPLHLVIAVGRFDSKRVHRTIGRMMRANTHLVAGLVRPPLLKQHVLRRIRYLLTGSHGRLIVYDCVELSLVRSAKRTLGIRPAAFCVKGGDQPIDHMPGRYARVHREVRRNTNVPRLQRIENHRHLPTKLREHLGWTTYRPNAIARVVYGTIGHA